MSGKGLRLGNKKSAILAGVTLYQLGVHKKARRVLDGEITLPQAGAAILRSAEENPTALVPAGVGWWFWGKPVKGKL